MKLKTFDVIAVENISFLATLISRVTRCKYTHVGIIVVIVGIPFVLESDKYGKGVKAGVILTPLSDYTDSKRVFKFFRLIHPTDEKDVTEYLKMTGRVKYDYFNLFVKLPIRFLLKNLFNIDVYLGDNNNTRLTCSEFVAYIFKDYFLDYSKISPKEIVESPHFKDIQI